MQSIPMVLACDKAYHLTDFQIMKLEFTNSSLFFRIELQQINEVSQQRANVVCGLLDINKKGETFQRS